MQNQLINLVILRHGEAGSASSDKLRPLTAKGKEQILLQCQKLKALDLNFDGIIHSPYLRTTESAMIAHKEFPNADIEVQPLLTPDGFPEMVIELLPNLGFNNILIVSHMPMVTYLTTGLTQLTDKNSDYFPYPIAAMSHLRLTIENREISENRVSGVIKKVNLLQKLIEV